MKYEFHISGIWRRWWWCSMFIPNFLSLCNSLIFLHSIYHLHMKISSHLAKFCRFLCTLNWSLFNTYTNIHYTEFLRYFELCPLRQKHTNKLAAHPASRGFTLGWSCTGRFRWFVWNSCVEDNLWFWWKLYCIIFWWWFSNFAHCTTQWKRTSNFLVLYVIFVFWRDASQSLICPCLSISCGKVRDNNVMGDF